MKNENEVLERIEERFLGADSSWFPIREILKRAVKEYFSILSENPNVKEFKIKLTRSEGELILSDPQTIIIGMDGALKEAGIETKKIGATGWESFNFSIE